MARLLVINFFPAFHPASSGGELRMGNLYRALAKTNDITLLTSTDHDVRYEEVQHHERFRELRFPKDGLWRQAYATLAASGLQGEFSGAAFALAVSDPTCRLRQVALRLAQEVDYIVHEFPYSEPIFAAGASAPEIYNAHNFEISLLASIIHGPGFEALFLKLMRLESNLSMRARYVFAASAVDADKFRLFYGVEPKKIAFCPNGFDDGELRDVAQARRSARHVDRRPQLLFMASHHAPNVDAAIFLMELAATLPECDIVLAGTVCQLLADRDVPENILRIGAFDSEAKKQLLLDADLFLNPVAVGSGTSLKALEALGANVPMVATPEGVRGLGLKHGVDVILSPREAFSEAIRSLLAAPSRMRKIAAAGRAAALRAFTWREIAGKFDAHLATLPPHPAAPASIFLALNDYPIHLSHSGGATRIRSLLESSPGDAVLVTFGRDYDFVLLAPGLLAVTVPKGNIHRAFENAVNSGQLITANDVIAALFATSSRVLSAIIPSLARRAHAVIFEHPYMAPFLPAITRQHPDLTIIYSAHNFETMHKAELLRAHKQGGILAPLAAELEAYLIEKSDLVLCCTQADAASFAALNGAVMVVSNGCHVPDRQTLNATTASGTEDEPIRIGFIGSSHGPNIAAVEYIVDRLAPAFPNVIFEVIGDVCTQVQPPDAHNVKFYGPVDDVAKTRILSTWRGGLNPVPSGGGSSLKLADYMAHGLVSVNTPAGARGFDVVARDAGYIAELSEFSDVLKVVLSDPLGSQIAANAYQYAVQNLSWEVCTREYRAYLQALLDRVATASPAPVRKLLVVTDEYAEPGASPAQTYLAEVLRQLRPQFGRIDLASIDAARLTQHQHFATLAEGVGQGATARIGELYDQALYFAPDDPPSNAMSRCGTLEFYWTQAEPYLMAPLLALSGDQNHPVLFGGFYPPEKGDGPVRRWSAPEFALLIPAGSRALRLKGSGPFNKMLRVTIARVTPAGAFEAQGQIALTISNSFSVSLAVPPQMGRTSAVVLCQVEQHLASGDHRPLGVLLEDATIFQNTSPDRRDDDAQVFALEEKHADLTRNIETELSGRAVQAWLTRLHDEALRQTSETCETFAAVHTMRSKSMRAWLQSSAGAYDIILVQGLRSDALSSIHEALLGSPGDTRIVALPHFHGTDRIDYWRQTLESLAAGQVNLLFSQDVADILKLGARAKIVPAGGVHAETALDPEALARFHDAFSPGRPFFLMMGDEAGSLASRRAAHALQELRREGIQIELVLIGTGPKHELAGAEGVCFLGEQPQVVVHGALSACVGVIELAKAAHFSDVVCKAWLFSKPVIANRRCAALREIIRHRENGWLVGSDWELVAAMRRLATDAEECSRIGTAGFADVHRRFTWPAVAQAVMDVLTGEDTDNR